MKNLVIILVLFQALVINGQDVKESFQNISKANSIEEIESIIRSNPDVLTYKQFDNRNILFEIENSKFEVFKVLLENGADPNEQDDGGWTPMTYNTSNYQLYQLYKDYGGVQ